MSEEWKPTINLMRLDAERHCYEAEIRRLKEALCEARAENERLRGKNNNFLEIASRWEFMRRLLNGETVSDFALSFQEVRKLDDIMSPSREVKSEDK